MTVLGRPDAPAGAEHTTIASRAASIIALGAAALLLVLGVRLLDTGAGDLGIAGLFSTDEQLAGQLVRAMLTHGNLGLSHFFSYGPLDLYLARFTLTPLTLFGAVSDRAILVTLRLISLIAGVGSIIVTYCLGRRLWSAATGALAALLLALSPLLMVWSTTAHPDTLQLFLLLLALWFAAALAGSGGRRNLIAASACASLAFATKYEGLLMLLPIWLALWLAPYQIRGCGVCEHDDGKSSRAGLLQRTRPWRALGLELLLSLAVFGAVFAAVDPSALLEPRRFVSQARAESALAHGGHLYVTSAAPLRWLQSLGSIEVLGPLALALGLAGLTVWLARDLRRPRGRRERERLPLEAWTAGFLILLLVWVGDRQPRYALPVLPGLALCGCALALALVTRLPDWRTRLAAGGAIAVLVALPLAARLLSDERTLARRMDHPQIAQRIAAGHWLGTTFPPETRILTDAYAYVPTAFSNTEQTFGLTRQAIATFRPRVIVTDAAIRDRFLDPAAAQRYLDGAAAYDAIAATYRALETGVIPCYPLLRAFGPVRIYGLPAGAGGAARRSC